MDMSSADSTNRPGYHRRRRGGSRDSRSDDAHSSGFHDIGGEVDDLEEGKSDSDQAIILNGDNESTPLLSCSSSKSRSRSSSRHSSPDLSEEDRLNRLLGTETGPSGGDVIKPNNEEYPLWELLKECWNWDTIYKDMFVRDRGEELFGLDGLRALAYLWVINIHVEEGLDIYYTSTDVSGAWGSVGASFVAYSANMGVVVFFVLSGFLIPMVFMSIAKKNKDGRYLSLRSIVTFLVRRYLRVAPSLMVSTLFVLAYGCLNFSGDTTSTSYVDFCTYCKMYWWDNFLFTANTFTMNIFCYNSSWTVSNEVQFYLLSVPLMWCYVWRKELGYFLVLSLASFAWWYRNYIDTTINHTQVYERADQYCMGIILYFLWEEFGRFKVYTEETAPTNCYFPLIKRERKLSTLKNFQTTYSTSTPRSNTSEQTQPSATSTAVSNSIQDETEEEAIVRTKPVSVEGETTILLEEADKDGERSDVLHVDDDNDWIENIQQYLFEWWGNVYDNALHYFMRYSCIVLSLLGIGHAIYSMWVNTEMAMSNYLVFAAGAGGIVYLCLEKSLYFVHWGLSRYFWFPLASLSYNGYLYSLPAAYMYSDYLWSSNGYKTNSRWVGTWVDWMYIYAMITVLNLILAIIGCYLVERPFMHLSKKFTFEDIHI